MAMIILCVLFISLKVDDYGEKGIGTQCRNYDTCDAINRNEVSWLEVATEEVDDECKCYPPEHCASQESNQYEGIAHHVGDLVHDGSLNITLGDNLTFGNSLLNCGLLCHALYSLRLSH